MSFRDACAKRLAQKWKTPLIKRSFAHYSSVDETTGVFCLNSREHKRREQSSYWFALHPHQLEALRKHSNVWLALGCGSADYLILIPLKELERWIPKMWMTIRENVSDRRYWHIAVIQKDAPMLSLTKPTDPVNLSAFVLA